MAVAALAAFGCLAPGKGQEPGQAMAAAQAGPPAPPATVNLAAYEAKMLELANLKPPKPAPAPAPSATIHTGRGHSGHAASARAAVKKVPAAAPPKPLWPVHTVLPDAGALLPFHRIVAFYGNFYSTQMGILGQYPTAEVVSKLQTVVAAWTAADPSTPVVPALDYIATSAQADAGDDGRYRLRMSSAQIDKALTLADQVHGLVFLDIQPGWSSLKAELPPLATYMQKANVELALDPEFALTPGKRPGVWRGTMSAAEINFAAEWLAQIVEANHLPPKILVIHRFTQAMVTDYRAIRPLPQVEIVMDMDGFGSPAMKTDAYHHFIARQPVQFTGFKLFYHNDVKWGGRLMTPANILALSPQPSYIVYQ
ncbi:MAG: hypothetical protein ACRD01_06290 [Terriglobales bacterium]